MNGTKRKIKEDTFVAIAKPMINELSVKYLTEVIFLRIIRIEMYTNTVYKKARVDSVVPKCANWMRLGVNMNNKDEVIRIVFLEYFSI